jgi:hypothetical protein
VAKAIIKDFKAGIMSVERKLKSMPNNMNAKDVGFKHKLEDGYYIRECVIPKHALMTTAIHKVPNPLFLLTGKASILTDKGCTRIKAPHYQMTKPGTKRIIFAHEECKFVTVHRTDRKDTRDVIKDVVTDQFDKKITKKQLKLLIGG